MTEERDLPVGWCWRRLADICSRIVDGSHNPPKSSDTGLPMLSARNIENRSINLDADYRLISLGDFEHENRRTNISAGDVLLTIVGSIGRTAEVTEGLLPFTLQRSVAVLKPTESATSRYLSYALESPDFQQFLVENSKGTAQKGIYLKALGNASIPVAPMAEQSRISAKLDTTLADVDACCQRLDGVAAILKRFRQAVLAAATSGELTREWREERGQVFEWLDVQLGEHAESMNYGTSAKSQREGEVPVLRMGNLQGGELDWTELVYTSDLAEIAKYLLDDGDVLFNRTNSPELVGKTAVYRGERPAIYAGYLIRVRCRPSLDPEFLNLSLNGPAARDYCWRVKSDGVSQSNINAKKLAAYPFLLPSVEEQKEIVRRAQELFCLADQLEARFTAARKVVDRLTPALLAKAFRGELVPQDPSDEPASVLLERIRAARQAEAAAGKSSGRGRKKAAALPDQLTLDAAPVPPDLLSGLLRECGALSERALLAASELDAGRFRRQLEHELKAGSIRDTNEEGKSLLEAVEAP